MELNCVALCSWPLALSSKSDFERELDHSRSGTCPRNSSKRRWHRDVVIRVREVGPIEKIKELSTKFTPYALSDRNELDYRKVHILLSWAIEEIARGVSKRVVRIERRIVWRS